MRSFYCISCSSRFSLFAFILAFASFDVEGSCPPGHPPHGAPGIAVFLFVSAAVLFVVWFVMTLLPAILSGRPPEVLEHYTTFPR